MLTTFLTFILALIIRLLFLDVTPAGFHLDEVGNSYIGRFILDNGVDIYGNPWPIFTVDKQTDMPPALPMYLNGLGTYLFGPDILGGRFIIAVLGALLVWPVAWLGKLLLGRIGEIAMPLVVTLAPWHWSLSRVGAEGVVGLTVYAMALWLVLVGLQRQRLSTITLGVTILWLDYLIYPTYRMFVPLTLCVITGVYWHDLTRRWQMWLVGGVLVSVLLTAWVLTTPWGTARYESISLMAQVPRDADWQSYRYNELNPLSAKIFQNKFVHLGRAFLEQYVSYFSPLFLFMRVSTPAWYALPQSGVLLLTWLIPLVLAVVFGHEWWSNLTVAQRRLWLVVGALFLLAPVTSALTIDHPPHIHRSLTMLLPFALLIGLGVSHMWRRWPRWLMCCWTALVVVEFVFAYHNYLQHVGLITALHRGDPNREIVRYLQEHAPRYKRAYAFTSGFLPTYYLYFAGIFDRNLVGKIKKMRIAEYQNIKFIENDCPLVGHRQMLSGEHDGLVLYSSTCSHKDLPSNCKPTGDIKGVGFKIPIYRIAECR